MTTFARNLEVAMSVKGMTNSDLARALWGEKPETDKAGLLPGDVALAIAALFNKASLAGRI